nr:SDR family NAD(P)-dependent oxidoreductase [Ktedonobacteraceae bacterium]MBA3826662.1 SDR family NAD(P)-dependent oxidoreductase [Ktedonobacterales bacterium]
MADTNSVAIVTGHSSGLGKSLARRLLESSWNVVGVSRSSTPHDLANRFPQQLTEVHGNVAQDSTAEAAFNQARQLGVVRLVVN